MFVLCLFILKFHLIKLNNLVTEIQNLQICDGDVARGLTIPIYMIFPRLFTCPSVSARTFKIQFELNVVVMFKDGYVFSQNIPIVIVRKKGSNY